MEVLDEAPRPVADPAPLSARSQDWLRRSRISAKEFSSGCISSGSTIGRVARRSRRVPLHYSMLIRGGAESRGLPPLGVRPPRLILLHTLRPSAHASARAGFRLFLNIDTGSHLRRRGDGGDPSLHGHARQRRESWWSYSASAGSSFEGLVLSALEAAEICSSDPLCSEHDARRTGRLNGAACHACAMASETPASSVIASRPRVGCRATWDREPWLCRTCPSVTSPGSGFFTGRHGPRSLPTEGARGRPRAAFGSSEFRACSARAGTPDCASGRAGSGPRRHPGGRRRCERCAGCA